MHLHAFSRLQLQKDPAQLGQLRGVVTALFITDAQCVSGWKSFDRGYLEIHLEKVARRTRAAHRRQGRNIVAGTRIQPTDDTVEEEGDGEESEDEDLDDM